MISVLHMITSRPTMLRQTHRLSAVIVMSIALTGTGCTALDFLFGPIPFGEVPITDLELGIAITQPSQAVTAAPGVATIVQWADIATLEGTVVRVTAQRRNTLDEDVGDPIELVGNGKPGTGREALGDGANDIFEWDITGVRVGDYVIIATIEAPDGTSLTTISRDSDRGTVGVITVTTALPRADAGFHCAGRQ